VPPTVEGARRASFARPNEYDSTAHTAHTSAPNQPMPALLNPSDIEKNWYTDPLVASPPR
jgi:hypothetical protein